MTAPAKKSTGEKEYGNDNPHVVAAKDSWHLIEEQSGVYVFSEAAFSN